MKSNNKLIVPLFALLLVVFLHPVSAEMDAIAAIVNDDVVLKSEVAQREREMNISDITTTKMAAESLVLEYLQAQKAAELGIVINDESLGKVIAKLASKNNLSVEAFAIQLAQQYQINFDNYRDSIRRKMMIEQLRKIQVVDYSSIKRSDIDDLIKRESVNLYQSDSFEFEHLFIPTPQGISMEHFRRLQIMADKKRASLLKGESFSQVMNKPTRTVNLNDVGNAKKAILRELSILEQGELSPVFHNNGGFHVVRLLKNKVTEKSFKKEYLVRHILLTGNGAEQKIKELYKRLHEGEYFSVLAKTYSKDSSAKSGGLLGWAISDKYVPPFARVVEMSALSVVSQPFKTKYGWHLLEVLDYRNSNLAQRKLRNDAERLLRRQQAKNSYEIWLKDQINSSYIEYRLD